MASMMMESRGRILEKTRDAAKKLIRLKAMKKNAETISTMTGIQESTFRRTKAVVKKRILTKAMSPNAIMTGTMTATEDLISQTRDAAESWMTMKAMSRSAKTGRIMMMMAKPTPQILAA